MNAKPDSQATARVEASGATTAGYSRIVLYFSQSPLTGIAESFANSGLTLLLSVVIARAYTTVQFADYILLVYLGLMLSGFTKATYLVPSVAAGVDHRNSAAVDGGLSALMALAVFGLAYNHVLIRSTPALAAAVIVVLFCNRETVRFLLIYARRQLLLLGLATTSIAALVILCILWLSLSWFRPPMGICLSLILVSHLIVRMRFVSFRALQMSNIRPLIKYAKWMLISTSIFAATDLVVPFVLRGAGFESKLVVWFASLQLANILSPMTRYSSNRLFRADPAWGLQQHITLVALLAIGAILGFVAAFSLLYPFIPKSNVLFAIALVSIVIGEFNGGIDTLLNRSGLQKHISTNVTVSSALAAILIVIGVAANEAIWMILYLPVKNTLLLTMNGRTYLRNR